MSFSLFELNEQLLLTESLIFFFNRRHENQSIYVRLVPFLGVLWYANAIHFDCAHMNIYVKKKPVFAVHFAVILAASKFYRNEPNQISLLAIHRHTFIYTYVHSDNSVNIQ